VVVYADAWVIWRSTISGPAGLAACAGAVLTVRDMLLLLPFPQLLEGTTAIFPLLLPTLTVIELVPWPAEMDEPDGTLQV